MTFSLLHISDIHLGPMFLAGRFVALKPLAERCDGIVVSGDLTQRAKKRQFQEARKALESFGKPVMAVAGNHDVPLYPVHLRLFAPYVRFKRHFKPALHDFMRIGRTALFGLTTAHGLTTTEGKVTAKQIPFLEKCYLRTSPSDTHILVIHHPLLPLPGESRDRSLKGAQPLIAWLAHHPFDLILSGHIHRSLFLELWNTYHRFPYRLPIIHTGSASTTRSRGKERGSNSAHIITIEESGFKVTRQVWMNNRFSPAESLTLPRNRFDRANPHARLLSVAG